MARMNDLSEVHGPAEHLLLPCHGHVLLLRGNHTSPLPSILQEGFCISLVS
jgi:hypothetical protein